MIIGLVTRSNSYSLNQKACSLTGFVFAIHIYQEDLVSLPA